jgi:hypothetical protein
MVTYNLKNPSVVPVPDPIDLDYAILRLQSRIAALSWLSLDNSKVFGRAFEMPRKSEDGRTINREPMVYIGNGEYYPPYPNDALAAFAFFHCPNPRDVIDHRAFTSPHNVSTPCSLIVWGNQKTIDPTRDMVSREILINQVVSQLNTDPKIKILRVSDENGRDIFRGFTLNETQRDLLMYPYFAFRIEFTLSYKMNCTAPVAFETPEPQVTWENQTSLNWEDLI